MTMNRIPRLGVAPFAAALLLTLNACTTVGPDYHVPAGAAINNPAAAGNFKEGNEPSYTPAPLPPHWWRLYQDPVLDGLIAKAFDANTDLRVAAANLARANAVQSQFEDASKPVVGFSAEPAYGKPSAVAMGIGEKIPNTWMYDAGMKVSYQVDLFGKISRSIEASRADTEASQAALDLTRVTIAAATANAYADICSAGQELATAKKSVEIQQEFVQSTEERVRSGRGTAFDTSRVKSQLEQLKAALPPLVAQQKIAQYRLAALLGGLPGSVPDDIAQCTKTLKISSPIPTGDGAALLKRRPDVRQAERRLAAATARIGVATADLYPSISLGLSAGSTGELTQFGAENAARWSIGPLISWTIPSTGSARSRIAQAQAGTDAELAHFDGTVLNALRETESALVLYARELDRNAALQAARDQSELAAQQARTLYRFGRTDFLTALDADRTLASQESVLAASNAKLADDQIALFLSLGGGWE
jgi:NodT family efflux transporter outer membrane factor (OMF) lipoprotein